MPIEHIVWQSCRLAPEKCMRFRSFLIALAVVSCTATAMGEQQFAKIGDFKLVSGEVIKDCRIGYRVMGQPNTDKTNVLVIPSWFDGYDYISQLEVMSNCGHMGTTCEIEKVAARINEFLE